LRPPSNSSLPV